MEPKSGEIRRVHIIYFLSRMGKIEHPHLIRVRHINRAGVYLRDVKRWLADLRGKDMPDSFSWSYKRRYKMGYVWQDLLDDDLITPISDNEYVLKGSEISALLSDQCASAENTTSIQKPDPVEDKTLHCPIVKNPESNANLTRNPNDTEMEKGDAVKRTVTSKLEREKFEEEEEEEEKLLESEPAKEDLKYSTVNDSFFNATPLADDGPKSGKNKKSQRSFLKMKSSNGASQMLRSILTCGAVDTNDSAMKTVNRRSKVTTNPEKKEEICRAEGPGGSQMAFAGTWNQHQQRPPLARKSFCGMKKSRKKSAVVAQKPVLGACMRIAEPNCSQCGKAFKPEKLHTHMKSCRAMKCLGGKSERTAEKTPQTTTEESSPAFLSTRSYQSFNK